MNPERQQTISYLQAPSNGLWRWAEDGRVIVWRDGTTIAFREEVVQILRWLTPSGLPPFGSVVLLLGACRGKLPQASEIMENPVAIVPAKPGAKAALLLSARRQLEAQLQAGLVELAKVCALPAELNCGIKAKSVLSEAVFEGARVERYVEGPAVLAGLKEPISDSDLNPAGSSGTTSNLVRQVHIVAEGLKSHSADSLALRLRTGLDALPKETDLDLPTAERARRLIEELNNDREHGTVARAARELMAAIRLPRRLAEREELAIGGISDITNRGPLDRLLLSELVHDDLTLAVRVALNEALYLRREPPMREPPRTLALLIDSGIRLWGLPRVLASAVALAFAACERHPCQILAFRAEGGEAYPIDLFSREGLVDHLSRLASAAHCGDALPAFSRQLPVGLEHQTIVITHSDVLSDPDFRRCLENPAVPGFIATVDRLGHFELHALPLGRRAAVCEADLDLPSILAERKKGPPLFNPLFAPNLPAIFGVQPFPFLLPFSGRPEFWFKAEDGFTYASMNDRRLIRFIDGTCGGSVLSAELPPGKTVWLTCDSQKVHMVKGGASQRPTRLISVPTTGGSLDVIDLEIGSELLAVHQVGEVLILIRRHDVRAFSMLDGKLLSRALNHYQWVHGRFLRGRDQFLFPAWDGLELRFERLSLPGDYQPALARLVFDREGLDGPWFVYAGGQVISSATGEIISLPCPSVRERDIEYLRVSRDGHYLLASVSAAKLACLADLRTGHSEKLPYPVQLGGKLLIDRPPVLPSWNLFRVVESIGFVDDGLAFRGRRGRWRKISLTEAGICIVDLNANDVADAKSFLPCPAHNNLGCTLAAAEWGTGSRVFLDSRGLLHLKSYDPSIAEVSLLLADSEVAGWTSDGYMCGPKFFFEEAVPSQPEKVFDRLAAFRALATA